MALSKYYLSVWAPAKSLQGMFCQWVQGDRVEIQGLAKYQPIFQYPAVLPPSEQLFVFAWQNFNWKPLKEIKKIVTMA